MKEESEAGSSSSGREDWDLGILGGRAEYLLNTDLVLHTSNTFFCSKSLTNIISLWNFLYILYIFTFYDYNINTIIIEELELL